MPKLTPFAAPPLQSQAVHPPPLTTVRFVCACHPVFATSGGSVAADIISQFLDEPVSRSLIHRAATLGSIRLLDRLVHQARSNGTDAFLLEHWLTKATKTAAEHGHLEVVRQLLRCSSEHEPSSYRTSCIETAVEGAMAGGQLVVLQEMVAMLDDGHARALLGTLQVSVLFIDVIEWLEGTQVRVLLDSSIPPGYSDELVLERVQWVVANETRLREFNQEEGSAEHALNIRDMLMSANWHGYDQVVRWLVEERFKDITDGVMMPAAGGPGPRSTNVLKFAIQRATKMPVGRALTILIEKGDLHNAELLLAHWPYLWLRAIKGHVCYHGCGLLRCAAASGSRAVMQWVLRYHRDHHPSAGALVPEKKMIKMAAGNGHLAMVQWLHNHSRADWDGSWSDSEDGEAMERVPNYHGEAREDEYEYAVANGHVEMVQWLLTHRPEALRVVDLWGAIRHGHLALVQILHEKLSESIDDDDPQKASAIQSAVAEGHFEVIMYACTHWSQRFNWRDVLTIKPIDFAIVKWAYANRALNTTSVLDNRASDMNNQVKTSIEHGRMGVMEWLIEKGLLVPGSLKALVDVAMRGDLYILQWFAARVPELMDWGLLQEATQSGEPSHVVEWLATRTQEQ